MRAAKIGKPLLSVRDLVEAGSTVVFSKGDCFIEGRDGRRLPIRETGKSFTFEAEVIDEVEGNRLKQRLLAAIQGSMGEDPSSPNDRRALRP